MIKNKKSINVFLMNKKEKLWCAVPGCMSIINEKRHFFRFPKEHDRWFQWIQACKRMDLESKSPSYAHQNCSLCHLHFEEKWLAEKTVNCLHPDAVPTIFFGPAFDTENIYVKLNSPVMTEEDRNTPSSTPEIKISEIPQEKKLCTKILHLEKQNKNLCKMIRQLRQIQRKQKNIIEIKKNDVEKMQKLDAKRGRSSSTDEEQRLDGKLHIIILHPQRKHKDCAVCSNRKIPDGRRETSYICETCENKPALHIGECFKRYHTMKNYKL